MDQDYLNLTKQLSDLNTKHTELKKAVAAGFILDTIQGLFNDVGESVVTCGCVHCIGPDEYDGPKGSEHDCLMYKYLKTKCVEFNVPVPNDEIDHPQLFPHSYVLSACLAGTSSYLDKQEETRWLPRVRALSFATQTSTLYKMIHAMNKAANPEVEDFDVWFSLAQFRL